MALCTLFITFSLPKKARFRYEFDKGTIWLHKDLISPYNYAIQKTAGEIDEDRADVLKTVYPVYQNDLTVALDQQKAFAEDFDLRWKPEYGNAQVRQLLFNTAKNLLSEIYTRGLASLNTKYLVNRQNYSFILLTNNQERRLNTADIYTPETAMNHVKAVLNGISQLPDTGWLSDLISDHLVQNYTYDERISNRLEKEALGNISTTRGMVQKGELIVSNGTIITPEIYNKLASLREAYENDAKLAGNMEWLVIGQLLLVSLCMIMVVMFLKLFRKDIYANTKLISLILMVITGMLVVLSIAMRMKVPSVYYIPYCAVPIIIRILFDTRLALNIHVLVILLAGFYVPNSFEFVFIQTVVGMGALYSIKNLVKRAQFLTSALIILCTYFVSFIGVSFIRNGSVTEIEWINFLPFIFSVLLSLLAYPLIYVFEKMFGINTDLTLIELSNTNSRLLRDLSYKAPGTFQHSLQVANLAEAAIFKIGGNALLVRAGALYHDIGKMENPQFFIENQNIGSNPHDNLSYEQSAQLIIRHVHKGVEMARRERIPEVVIDFIRTHHGNTRVDYFYQSFLKNFPEKLVDENIFRYPGPIPFSKETAVMMLADSVEAASRSLKEPTSESISQLVDRIVDYKLEQNQLKNSNITLKDIETIKLIFKTMLMGIYHVRIDYAT
jgi:putative nucleotidyltransferase with HDIG domain